MPQPGLPSRLSEVNHARVVRTTLTDGSYTFDVHLYQYDQEVSISCLDEEDARELVLMITSTSDMDALPDLEREH